MARAYAIVGIVLILSASMLASAAPRVIQRTNDAPGWELDRFTMAGTRITIAISVRASEVSGGIVHLYSGAGVPLKSSAYVFLGGNNPDVEAGVPGAKLGSDELLATERDPTATSIAFDCPATCNPSREFILVTSAAGTNLTSWSMSVFADGASRVSNTSGASAGALSTRQFAGLGAHAGVGSDAGASLRGLNVAQGATHTVGIGATFAGGFVRFNGPEPLAMTLQTPSGTIDCPCALRAGAPGSYTFRYDNAATTSDESYAIWADVPLG